MKRSITILFVALLSFIIGWWTHIMFQYARGVNEDFKRGNYKLTYVRPADTTNFRRGFFVNQLNNSTSDTIRSNNIINTVIRDEETALRVSEAILFKIYGETNIKKQRPYILDHINDYWLLTGTLPKGTIGGTFLIILKGSTGQVVKLTHGK